jgi:hypothetical protein
VIANKGPGQTAWEAANELKQNAQDAITEVKKEPIVIESAHDVAEQYANFEEMLKKTLDSEEQPASATSERSSVARPVPEAEKLEPLTWIADEGASPEDLLPKPADAPENATSPPSLLNLPDLSPAPATRAPLGESETPEQNPASPSRLTFRKDYGDVKSAYERASRFLAEIK